jgi:hypothetical protein
MPCVADPLSTKKLLDPHYSYTTLEARRDLHRLQ